MRRRDRVRGHADRDGGTRSRPDSNGTYGLGLFDTTGGYSPGAVGHQGEGLGYMSWAACLPEEGAVVVVLTNRPVRAITVELFDGALRPFVDALRSR